MTNHRASFKKTVIIAVLLALAELSVLVWVTPENLDLPKPGLLVALAWWAAVLTLICCEAVTLFVMAGGLIALYRDSLEDRGIPYGLRPREWHAGFLVRSGRALLRGLRRLRGVRPGQLDLRAGESVEIRSLGEILATLDSKGEYEAVPFMPEMEAWCGKQARVFRRVDKIFDWILSSGLRKMNDTVILQGLRCDGRHHGGCQGDCALLWKEIWLRRSSAGHETPTASVARHNMDLIQFTTRIDEATSEQRWVCQLCRMPAATTPTRWNDPRNILRELLNGNVRLGHVLSVISILFFNSTQRRFGGQRFPYSAPSQAKSTPHHVLNLQPGELVRVKTRNEIEKTLDSNHKNRGLWFDKEMTRFCGGTFRVLARATCQIDERTGKMRNFTNPCITLEDVTASGEYHEFAPLDERIFWREIWLERVPKADV